MQKVHRCYAYLNAFCSSENLQAFSLSIFHFVIPSISLPVLLSFCLSVFYLVIVHIRPSLFNFICLSFSPLVLIMLTIAMMMIIDNCCRCYQIAEQASLLPRSPNHVGLGWGTWLASLLLSELEWKREVGGGNHRKLENSTTNTKKKAAAII